MTNPHRRNIGITVGLFIAFSLWTVAICWIDVQPIGPRNSAVGFAMLNGWFHRFTGVHMLLCTVTDWMGLIPVAVGLGFAALGLGQLIRRRSLAKVDCSILALGGFYLLILGAYVLFEMFPINYRPVLIDGYLEASYPSSTTLLALCILPTAGMQLKSRMREGWIRNTVVCALWAVTGVMAIGRLLAGVHWISDIAGSLLLSGGLVMLYRTACEWFDTKSLAGQQPVAVSLRQPRYSGKTARRQIP